MVNSHQKPFIIWQFILIGHNEGGIKEIQKLAKEADVDDLTLKAAQIYNFEEGSSFLPKNPKYARYEKDGLKYKIQNELLSHCWRMWQGCIVTWDGKIVTCCFNKDTTCQNS